MHKRIFLKYYGVCVVIIIITITVLAFISSSVIGIKSFKTQTDIMERAANTIASTVAQMPKNFHFIAGSIFNEALETVKDTIRSEVIVLNENGDLTETTLDIRSKDIDSLLNQNMVNYVLDGNIYKKGSSITTDTPHIGYTVGVPIIVADNVIGGAVFVSTSEINMSGLIFGTLTIFLLCGITVLMCAFVILYFLTKKMTKPIYQMSEIANSYSKGDFSKRLEVGPYSEYAPLAAAFNSMADGIDQLEQMRRGFIADVSHELRTPMTSITGFIDGMLDGTIPPELYPKYLSLVSEEAHRMTRMVSSFLDVAKIQAGQISYVKKPFDIVQTAGKALFTLDERIEQADIKVNAEFENDSIIVNGDEDAIYRVMFNLLDNAVKFTKQGGEITVRIKRAGSKAEIYVKNTGDGISKEDAAHIFERFYKADKSRGMNKKGTGIGLYLVKNIIKEHGEDITLTSKEGEFAQFMFTLPIYND